MIQRAFRGLVAASGIAVISLSSFAGTACPPDINNDTVVNAQDLLAVVSAWGACGDCVADIAPIGGNDQVNSGDLVSVIAAWGSCAACSPSQGCLSATSLWCENFELNNYSRWSGTYSAPTSCESTGFTSEHPRAGSKAHKSRVLCATASSHRGYAGLRFQGDVVLPSQSIPSTGGIDAPNGVVVTLWSWVDSSYTFDSNRWLSLLTCTNDCSNNWNGVITLNLDDSSMRLKPVHVSSVAYAPNAPAFPRGQWNRITVYLNYYAGSMHVWQNGAKVCSATFSRPSNRMCQWHFGLYASGPNSDITLYEDDYSIVRLNQPMVNFTAEPRFPALFSPCGILP